MRASVALVLLAGCEVTGVFHCETSEQCVQRGEQGMCITGSCAFADPGCDSGWRYADSSQDDVAGSCLDRSSPAGCETWMPRHFMPCALPAPLGDLRLSSGYVYDTDHGAFLGGPKLDHASVVTAQPDGTPARVISVGSFAIDGGVRLRVIGSLPLIVASWSDIAIGGVIEVDSTLGALSGAGANPAACSTGAPQAGEPGVASRGSGGGGGGAFGGAGGKGGIADVDNQPGRQGGAGGTAVAMAMRATTVRGGCPGARGGSIGPGATAPLTAMTAASGGAGGGAIQLTARGRVALSAGAVIEAGGAGGVGGPGGEAGGGGGGSGGFIGLEGTMVTLASGSIVAANGGGGGGGASNTAPGGTGSNATANNNAAPGGNGAAGAGGGLPGAANTTLAGGSANDANSFDEAGGGGGGGGAGVIVVRGTVTMTGAQVSPPVTVDP